MDSVPDAGWSVTDFCMASKGEGAGIVRGLWTASGALFAGFVFKQVHADLCGHGRWGKALLPTKPLQM
jgi:hypothetical protein